MDVSLWVWGISIAGIVGFFIFDFYSHVRHAHEPSLRESGFWSVFYIVISVLFMVGLGFVWDWEHAGEFIAGYTTEKALSVDNLFVFLIMMTSFKVPKEAQQKVLLIGIAIALVVRTAFIIAGAALLDAWAWVFYIFAAWMFYMGVKQAIESFKHDDLEMPGWVNIVRRFIRTSDNYNSDKWTIVENGQRALTPIVLVVVALGAVDVLFALDSIPAIFGITQEPYLVFMANAFALLGLRQLYFLIGGLLQRLVFLDLGLAFILSFIGVKLLFHALHENEVWFINGGEHVEWIPEIPIWFSLVFIFGVLIVATVASLIYSSTQKDTAEPGGSGRSGADAGGDATGAAHGDDVDGRLAAPGDAETDPDRGAAAVPATGDAPAAGLPAAGDAAGHTADGVADEVLRRARAGREGGTGER
ncbi:tellurium resistance protein TerC [Pseudoclavibacter endophyticus]|uniref:TerC/Alx family metal homeostasis membrane protein n=1 Tax=Pseudoclavibacter endophyticus TaxID=1778590 RepID=A0A6H9WHJ1_9MICO|nr:TerC/Alx family metal homeostasis membrane protein [Pseudoclavibacter endophyticus]KAB1647867.1 TerC/Alx family metal homeostasis membrane protein [Pseudoclavibacter endophyticus]GGA73434.1 tellurium resistance protein TerC [Pseudoclavibacter endophyticus]